jgi:O-antigen ligase
MNVLTAAKRQAVFGYRKITSSLGKVWAFAARHQKFIRSMMAVLAIIFTLAFGAYLSISFGKRAPIEGLVAGLVIAFLPLAIYLAVTRPIIFPFSIYVLLIPFDNLLATSLPQGGGDSGSLGTLTKLFAICSAAAFLFWLIRNRRTVKLPDAAPLWVALLLLMSLSVFWAIDPGDSLQSLVRYAELIALYIVVSMMPVTQFEYKFVIGAAVLGGLAVSAYGVYSFFHGTNVLFSHRAGEEVSSRVIIQAGEDSIDPNAFAAALLLPISIVAMWALRLRWSVGKLLSMGSFLLLMAGVYASGSRGALVSVAAMVGYYIFRSKYKTQLITLSLIALVASFFMPTSPWARFSNAAETGGAGRLSIWKVGLSSLKHYWLQGAGVGNYPNAYDQSFINVYQQHTERWHRVGHNMLLTTAVELGVLGLIITLWAWYRELKSLRTIGRASQMYDLRVALEGCVVGLFVASMFLGVMSQKYTWLLFEVLALTRTLAILPAPVPESPVTRRLDHVYAVARPPEADLERPAHA